MLLGSEWDEANGDDKWRKGVVTVKIFNDEEEYKNYQNGQEKSIDSDSDESIPFDDFE